MLAITVTSVILYVLFIVRTSFHYQGKLFFTLFDDAMVSMQYAKNLADGFGLVWNPGGAPVEGYTNFLWTLYMAFLYLLPIPESKISLAVAVTGVVILALTYSLKKK